MQQNQVPSMEVKVYRDKDNIYINGVRYPIQQAQRGTVSDRVSSLVVPKEGKAVMRRVALLRRDIEALIYGD